VGAGAHDHHRLVRRLAEQFHVEKHEDPRVVDDVPILTRNITPRLWTRRWLIVFSIWKMLLSFNSTWLYFSKIPFGYPLKIKH
jgi:hypothetical protein